MTSTQWRHEKRYQRRKAERAAKKAERYAEMDRFENIASYRSLEKANRVSMRNVCWKASVQRYQMNLLRNLEETSRKLKSGEPVTKGFVEFDAMERGKRRHIRSVHYSERVVQRSTCDNALVPMLRRSLIYDNGACLEGRGVDWAMERLTAHLQQFYRANGFSNKGWAVVFDFKGYFDNILHSVCLRIYSKQFRDQRILDLLREFIVPFGYPEAEESWVRVKAQDRNGYTGKSLGLGSQISQITAVSYPNELDHYIKQGLIIRWYGRYMDDGYMLFHRKEDAKEAMVKAIVCCERLGITINKNKTKLVPIERGFRFLKATHRLTETGKVVRKLCRDSERRQRRRLKRFAKKVAAGEMQMADVRGAYCSWKGGALRRGGKRSVRKMDRLYRELFREEPPRCEIKKLHGRKAKWNKPKKAA